MTIKVENSYKFIYYDEDQKKHNITISEVWDFIENDEYYFIRLKKNGFPWNILKKYKLQELYLLKYPL